MQTKQSTYLKHFQTLNTIRLLNIPIRLQTLACFKYTPTTHIVLQIFQSGLLFLASHDCRPASTSVQAREFQIFCVHANLTSRCRLSRLRGCGEPRLMLRRQSRHNRRIEHRKYHYKTSPKMHLVSEKWCCTLYTLCITVYPELCGVAMLILAWCVLYDHGGFLFISCLKRITLST